MNESRVMNCVNVRQSEALCSTLVHPLAPLGRVGVSSLFSLRQKQRHGASTSGLADVHEQTE